MFIFLDVLQIFLWSTLMDQLFMLVLIGEGAELLSTVFACVLGFSNSHRDLFMDGGLGIIDGGNELIFRH